MTGFDVNGCFFISFCLGPTYLRLGGRFSSFVELSRMRFADFGFISGIGRWIGDHGDFSPGVFIY